MTKANATSAGVASFTCSNFDSLCPRDSNTFNGECYDTMQTFKSGAFSKDFYFDDLPGFTDDCLKCSKFDYEHGTFIFNTFIWAQIFNEYTSRDIFDEWNFLKGVFNNLTFVYVSIFSIGAQIFLVEVGGDFVKTTHLSAVNWLICVGLGFIGAILGMLMRFIPVKEDPSTFFDNSEYFSIDSAVKMKKDIEMSAMEEKT